MYIYIYIQYIHYNIYVYIYWKNENIWKYIETYGEKVTSSWLFCFARPGNLGDASVLPPTSIKGPARIRV